MSAIDDLQAIDDDDDKCLQLSKEMELNSADNRFQELSHILTENEPPSPEEQIPESAFGNQPANNDGFSYFEFCASPQQIFSPLQAGFSDNVVFSDAEFITKPYYQEHEGEDLCNDYLSKSVFTDAEVSGTITESCLKEEVICAPNNESIKSEFAYEEAADDVLDVPITNNESTKSEDEVLDVLKMTHSPRSSLEDKPEDSSLIPEIENENNASLNMIQQKERYIHDGEASEQIIESSSKIHVDEEQETENIPNANASPAGSDHSVPRNDKKSRTREPSASHGSGSPRNQHSVRNHRSRKRSVSKSPSRRKETSSRYRRDHRERSRSRSPRRRHYRRSRSPRRRYSPSYRSPPSSYRSRYRSPKRRNWSPPHNRSTGLGKPGKNLFIAGFCFLTTERDLERKFSRFGRVRDVRIVRNKRSGESRGFGFLTLERDEEADEAIRVLDKTEWNGRVILVEKSKPNS